MGTLFEVGDHIRIERDEVKYPSKGTWPTHRGKTGFVCVVNAQGGPKDKKTGEWTPEYGVVLTVHRPRWRKDPGHEDQLQYDSDAVKWFAPYELRHAGA